MEVTELPGKTEADTMVCVELDSGKMFSDYKEAVKSLPEEQTPDAAFKMEDILYTRESYNVRRGIKNAFDFKDEMLAV